MLKQLKLRKQIELKRKEQEEFKTKEEELQKREKELEKALEECETEEDMSVVEEDIEKLDTEKKANNEKKSAIEKEIADLEKELKETEEKENKQEKTEDSLEEQAKENKEDAERASEKFKDEKENRSMKKINLTRAQIKDYLTREDNRKFISNIRTAVEKRSIQNLDLTIPSEIMELITDNVGQTSIFYNLVNVRPVGGKARANIVAEATEAIWTEMVGKINELEYALSQIEVDGYKVGGFTGVDNSILEDSDEDVFALVVALLSESIAIALDKAIAFGKGKESKMPTGYVTDLKNDVNLKTTNIVNLDKESSTLANIVAALGNIDRGISNKGKITIVMNEKTWLKSVIPLSLATNSAGAYITAAQGVFPGTGYKVEFCNQIPEDNIHAGDYSKYLLAERKGKSVKSSAEAKFIEDLTVFKATARYDGIPSRKSAFVIIGINGTEASTEATFAADGANAISLKNSVKVATAKKGN